MPLTTEGLIEELHRFRTDKMALVALIGSMGHESEADALERLRFVRDNASTWLAEHRRKKRAEKSNDRALARVWQDVYDLCTEVEPWLAQVVDLPAKEQAERYVKLVRKAREATS